MVCPAESLIHSLTKNFDSYKKSVFEFVGIGKEADMASLKVEQDEFARQITCLRKILKAWWRGPLPEFTVIDIHSN